MAITCTAVYEKGVLRPTEPLNLEDGAEVEVVVTPKPQSERAPSAQAAYEMVKKLAAMPIEGKDDGFSGRDHDAVLYPKQGKMP